MIAFSWHTWHASIGGRDRRQWTISYGKDPATSEEAARLNEFIASLAPEGTEPHDHDAYPCYDDHWLTRRPRRP